MTTRQRRKPKPKVCLRKPTDTPLYRSTVDDLKFDPEKVLVMPHGT